MPVRSLAASVLFGLACATVSAHAATPTSKDVLDASDRARGKLPGVIWTVAMTSLEDGKETKQEMEVKAAGENALATVREPLRSKGQMMLFAGRNMWFIKPGLSKPVPISPRQKMMGQAANGDIASTNYSGDYSAQFEPEEAINGEPCYVLNLTATNKNVTYDKIKYWVAKQRLVGVKADFFTVSGKKIKSALFEYKNSVSHKGEKIQFVSKMVISDAVNADDVTTLEYSDITVKALPESTFNLNVLLR